MVSLPPAPNRACPQPGETIDSHTERNSQASPPSHPTIKKTQLATNISPVLEIFHLNVVFFSHNINPTQLTVNALHLAMHF